MNQEQQNTMAETRSESDSGVDADRLRLQDPHK